MKIDFRELYWCAAAHLLYYNTEKNFFNIRRKDLHLFQFCSIIKEIVIYPMKQGEKLWYY